MPDVSQAGATPFDYIICATKNMPDIGPSIADLIRPAVTPGHSAILLLQNGLNIEVPLFEAFPKNVILSGISICGSSEPVTGTIEHNLHDELRVGPFRDEGDAADRAKDFVARYGAGGRCTCHYDTNVAFSRWRKLLYNAVYNPVGALTDLDTGDMQLCPGLVDDVVRPAMKEIQAAAAAYGQEISDEAIEAMITTEPIEAHVPPSMLVDVRKVRHHAPSSSHPTVEDMQLLTRLRGNTSSLRTSLVSLSGLLKLVKSRLPSCKIYTRWLGAISGRSKESARLEGYLAQIVTID